MATIKELKTRKKSVVSTQKITSAMKLIAASRLKKSQDNMNKARPYSFKIKNMIVEFTRIVKNYDHDFLKSNPAGKKLYIVVTSDKGLCGSFNASVIKLFHSKLKEFSSEEFLVIAIGNKIVQNMKTNKIPMYREYSDAFKDFDFTLASDIGKDLMSLYKKGEVSEVVLVYNKFLNAISQELMFEKLLPLNFDNEAEIDNGQAVSEYLIEPDEKTILDSLFPSYVNTQIWKIFLESYASENAARMMAMDNATENANEMISTLELQINKARQAAITQEIAEIVGGASVLN